MRRRTLPRVDRTQAQDLLDAVADGSLDPADALDQLATAPYDELAHSLVDVHRALRTGDPEVVYGAGKTTAQVLEVVEALRASGDRAVLVTRATPEMVEALRRAHDEVTVEGRPGGGTVAVGPLPLGRGTVAVLAAGTSDGPVAAEAALTARVFGAGVERVDDVGRGRAAPPARRPSGPRPRRLPRRRRRHGGRAAVRRRRPRRHAARGGADERRLRRELRRPRRPAGHAERLRARHQRRQHRQRLRRRRVRRAGRPAHAPVIGWLDCSAGASGDMLLGALVDAGVELAVLQAAVDAVGVEPVRLSAATVTRGGLGARLVDVHVDEHPRTRTWSDVRRLLEDADLAGPVRATALDVFARLATAEAGVHRTSPDDVHFHEVGALDAVADVVGTAAGLDALGLTRLTSSPVVLGSGTTRGAHGPLPVPPTGGARAAAGRARAGRTGGQGMTTRPARPSSRRSCRRTARCRRWCCGAVAPEPAGATRRRWRTSSAWCSVSRRPRRPAHRTPVPSSSRPTSTTSTRACGPACCRRCSPPARPTPG
jgi:hypothetical protein